MNTYEFILNICHDSTRGIDALESVADALYGGACDDASVGAIDEAMYIEFERDAESLESAILQAVKDVESTQGVNLVVSSVEGDLVSLGEAAELIGLSKSTLTKYKKGAFGGGHFPAPARKVTKKDPVWRLWDIAEWLYAKGKASENVVSTAKTVSLINNALEARKYKQDREYSHITAVL